MGVWSGPLQDVQLAQRFADILSDDRPYPPTNPDPFWDTVGDDGFHDLLAAMAKYDPEGDARNAAAAWVAGWIGDGDGRWSRGFDPEAVEIVGTAVEAWQVANPDKTILPPEWQTYFVGKPRSALS